MRELKFRAWDKKRKCYAKHIMTANTSCPYHDRMNMFKGVMTFSKWLLRRYIIEQYTGLKDKNDKEIYEGDIVASSYFGEDRILKVVFYEGCFCLCETRLEIPQVGAVYYFRQGSRFRPQDDYEVIGNIHENGDLLGDTNVTNKEEEK